MDRALHHIFLLPSSSLNIIFCEILKFLSSARRTCWWENTLHTSTHSNLSLHPPFSPPPSLHGFPALIPTFKLLAASSPGHFALFSLLLTAS